MKKFRLVAIVFNWFVSIVCGWIGVIWFVSGEQTDVFNFAAEHRFVGLLVFVIALLAVVLNTVWFVLKHVYGGGPQRHVSVAGEDSDVLIAVNAVEKALAKALLAEPEVCDAEVELSYDRNSRRITKVSARGTIWDGPDVLQTQLKMRSILEGRIHEIIRPEVMPEFDVKVDGLRFHEGKNKPKFRDRVDQVKDSFSGPQYPVR